MDQRPERDGGRVQLGRWRPVEVRPDRRDSTAAEQTPSGHAWYPERRRLATGRTPLGGASSGAGRDLADLETWDTEIRARAIRIGPGPMDRESVSVVRPGVSRTTRSTPANGGALTSAGPRVARSRRTLEQTAGGDLCSKTACLPLQVARHGTAFRGRPSDVLLKVVEAVPQRSEGSAGVPPNACGVAGGKGLNGLQLGEDRRVERRPALDRQRDPDGRPDLDPAPSQRVDGYRGAGRGDTQPDPALVDLPGAACERADAERLGMVRRLRPAPVPVRGEGDHPGSRRPVPSRFVCWRPVRSSCELRGRVRGLENCVPSVKCLYSFIVQAVCGSPSGPPSRRWASVSSSG